MLIGALLSCVLQCQRVPGYSDVISIISILPYLHILAYKHINLLA